MNPTTKPKEQPYDTLTVDHIGYPADEAWSAAEKLAQQGQYTREHRTTTIRESFSMALVEVETRAKETITDLEQKIAALEPVAAYISTPTPEQAQQLNYVLKVFENNKPAAATLMGEWRAALANKDGIKARAIMDYYPGAYRAEVKNPTADPGPRYEEMSQQTIELIATDEQRRARADLAKHRETLKRAKMAQMKHTNRLTYWNLTRDDTLVDDTARALMGSFRL